MNHSIIMYGILGVPRADVLVDEGSLSRYAPEVFGVLWRNMSRIYDKAIGYSPLQDVDRHKLRDLVRVNKSIIDKYFNGGVGDRILVAGAGQGDEAEFVFELFDLPTIGVDINIENINCAGSRPGLTLCKQNLTRLAFKGEGFSLIYCYHVLEHVVDHLTVLSEFHRVMCPNSVLFVGFPNRHRLISYIGTSQKVSFLEKVKWNLNDYKYRLMGRFENKYGAHAGFSEHEFLRDARAIFSCVYSVRDEYMLSKYKRLSWLVRFAVVMRLGEVLFPSNYYICLK